MKIAAFVLSLAIVSLPFAANAQVVKCKDASGHMTFQNVPCAGDQGGTEIKRLAPLPKVDASAARPKVDRQEPVQPKTKGSAPPSEFDEKKFAAAMEAYSKQMACEQARIFLRGVNSGEKTPYLKNGEFYTETPAEYAARLAEVERIARSCIK